AEELARFQTGRLVEAHAYSRGELVLRWARRNRRVLVAVGAALVMLVVVAAFAVIRVVNERDRAEEQRDHAHRVTVAMYEEQGRRELRAGRTMRALAFLNQAYQEGNDSPSLRFLLGAALRDVEAQVVSVECGAELTGLGISPDSKRLLTACRDHIRVWD